MIKVIFGILLLTSFSYAEMGVPVKIKLKSPSGIYPTESGLNVKVLVLSPETNCILREENFSSQSINNGSLVVYLGSGVRGVNDPNLNLTQIYDNSKTKTGLSCIDVNNSIVQTGQVFNPLSDSYRVVRIITTVSGESITLNFNMKSTPYAIQAESVGGKLGSDIIANDITTQMNQTNLNDLLFDITRFNNLKNLAITGQVNSAASATQAISFTGGLSGDVSGTQASTSVNKIKGIPVSAVAPTSGQTLVFNGTEYSPSTPTSAPVSSVAGRTGSIVLSSSDISGLGNSASLNIGSVAGTVAAGDDSRIVLAATEISNATSSNTVNTIVKRDASGNITVGNMSSTNVSTNNIYLYDGVNSVRLKAPAGLASSLVFNLPNSSGLTGQVLQTDGAGNLSWVTPIAGGSVNSVTASAPLTSSGGANPNISISVGTGVGTVAAGDDARINGAIQQSAFNGYVVSSNCTSSQTMYWNSVSSQFLCQSISFPADAVLNVAGRTGNVVLSSSDISGLGNSAGLNVGITAATVAAGDDLRIVNSDAAITAATELNTANVMVKRDATGSFSAQNLNLSGDMTVAGAVNGLSKNTVYHNAPTTAGTVTAYTLSYGVAMDAKILTNTPGDTVRFKVNAANTGAATLKVAGAPAASLFSAFTGLSVAAGDLQVGYYEATFDGINWSVKIPPRVFKNSAAINWAATTALTITAADVNAGDYVTCSFSTSTATATTTTKYWNTSVLVRTGFIQVVGVRVGTPPNVTGVRCMVQK